MFRFREVCGRPLGKKAVETLHSRHVSLYLSSLGSVKRRVGRANEAWSLPIFDIRVCHRRSAHSCHRWKCCPSMQFLNGKEWQHEPKWDGFRCLAFRDEDKIEVQSKSPQPLARYFPELVKAFRRRRRDDLFWMERSPFRKAPVFRLTPCCSGSSGSFAHPASHDRQSFPPWHEIAPLAARQVAGAM